MGPRLGFSYDAWSSGLHGVLMFFAASSVAGRVERFHVLDQRGCVRWTVDAQRSGESPPPNRLLHALRYGCTHAPRPGRLVPVSTITASSPFPSDTATTRSSSTASSRFRHPTHVRTGPSTRLCAETEGSRWITAQSSVTYPMVRTARGSGRSPRPARVCHVSGRAPSRGWPRVRGGRPNAHRIRLACRRGCRCATR